MIIDLFAGAGGWDCAARELGLPDPIGYELDNDACNTRRAANMPTEQVDIATAELPGRITGLIASPPCQSFSSAGKRSGLADERGQLVYQPLRWAKACRPDWCAWEQVPEVLPIWQTCANELRQLGYSVWCGVLDAERYGVPQTRSRAILIAHLHRPVEPPAPTHQKYVHNVPRGDPHACGLDNMFDAGVKPWVSMADALGWPDDGRELVQGNQANACVRSLNEPSGTIAFGHNAAAHRWVFTRPATTIATDSRVSLPGHHDPIEGHSSQYGPDPIRLTVEQAAPLQTFPADHPWQGGKGSKHRQIGNAIPPMLAAAILRQVVA